jgi:putative ABC transport system permease protein
MRRLSSLAWRSLAERRGRSLLTIAGVALGVGVLFAAITTNAAVDGSIDRTVSTILGRGDLRVSALGEAGLSQASLDAIASTAGVTDVSPELQARTFLERAPTAPEAGYADPVAVLGVDPAAYERMHDLRIVEGTGLGAGAADLLVTQHLRDETGLRVGDELTLLGSAAAGPTSFRVGGVIAVDGPVVQALGRTILMPIAAARSLFGLAGATRVDLRVADGTPVDAVVADLERRLTTQPFLVSTPEEVAASLRASAADFQSLTALVAAIALFAGAFLIFNTLSMTVTERVRDVGLLRAAGTTRRQVNGLILLQALAIGAAGSVAGVIVGFALAAAIAGIVRSVQGIPIDRIELSPGGVAGAFAVGLLVTLAAALEPAWRAGRISPVEALRARLDPAVGLRARLRWLIVVFVAVMIAAVAAWPRADGPADVIRPVAVYGLFLLGALVTPFLLGPLGSVAAIPFRAILPLEERLTRGSLVRDRSRAALTLGALTIGVAMIVALSGLALNARNAASAWLAGVIPGDEVVTSIRPAALDEGIQTELGAVDGVAHVTPIGTFDVAAQGVRLDAAAISGADYLADGRLAFASGDRATALAALDAGGAVVLPVSMADRLHVGVGDALDVLGALARPVSLRVVGTVERSLPGAGGESMLVGWSDATDRLGVLGADFFAVRFAPGRADAARPALESAARGLALQPQALTDVEGAIGGALGQVFGLFDALAVVAVVMAGLGMVNTLTMNVIERVREIGVLRAAGMTRGQVARMVVVEAGVLGIVGAILGVALGLGASAVMVALSGGGLSAGLEVPWAGVIGAAVFGVVVAMLAAWQPARVAGRISIVRAVQFE